MNASTPDRVRLTLPITNATLWNRLMLGASFQTQARKVGGEGRVFRAPNCVFIDLDGVSESHVDLLISEMATTLIREKADLKIAKSLRTTELPPTIMRGEYLYEKLTKKFLLELPQGVWLVSSAQSWTARLFEDTDRHRVWEQASECGAARNLVSVVWTEEDAKIIAESAASPNRAERNHQPPHNETEI